MLRGPGRFYILALLVSLGVGSILFYLGALPASWSNTPNIFTDEQSPTLPDHFLYSHEDGRTNNVAQPDDPSPLDPTDIREVFSSPDASSDLPMVESEQQAPESGQITGSSLPSHYIYNDVEKVHRTVYSVSTPDRKYFPIVFEGQNAYNPNIIPHRTLNDTYIIVAQQSEHSVPDSVWFAELACNAKFEAGKLKCSAPLILPIAATFGGKCTGKLMFFNFNIGPHDARVFYGPTKPFVLYGSNSAYACFGQFIQDFRLLVDWGMEKLEDPWMIRPTEIQRPGGYSPIEKNFFIFFDSAGVMYAHHDVFPKRVFAKLEQDGSIGPNLGLSAGDDKCLAKLMPKVAEKLESIHQSTNSLSITLCERSDPSCVPNSENTFIFHIFQHKSYYAFHSNYEPYLMLINQDAPFTVHAIAQKPIWIHGRALPGQGSRPDYFPEADIWDQTEMMYITSIAWATQGQKYHGYRDDTLFLAFGIEDKLTGGIDVRADDLLQDLAFCSSI